MTKYSVPRWRLASVFFALVLVGTAACGSDATGSSSAGPDEMLAATEPSDSGSGSADPDSNDGKGDDEVRSEATDASGLTASESDPNTNEGDVEENGDVADGSDDDLGNGGGPASQDDGVDDGVSEGDSVADSRDDSDGDIPRVADGPVAGDKTPVVEVEPAFCEAVADLLAVEDDDPGTPEEARKAVEKAAVLFERIRESAPPEAADSVDEMVRWVEKVSEVAASREYDPQIFQDGGLLDDMGEDFDDDVIVEVIEIATVSCDPT